MFDDLPSRFSAVKERVVQSVLNANRNEDNVHLIAVSKTYSAEYIRALHQYGQYDFGENYIQEWLNKVEELRDLPIRWHVIGPVQSNKTRFVAQHAQWLHSLDNIRIARRLSSQRPSTLPALNVCIQVNVSGENSKSGVHPENVLAFALAVGQLPSLCLKGLMCLPENTDDVEKLSKQFEQMQQLLLSMQNAGLPVSVLSMGMSADLELAIAHGATHIRVGTAIFGSR